MKRVIVIILCLILLLSVNGCTTVKDSTNVDNQGNKGKEITILIDNYFYSKIKFAFNTLDLYKRKFEREKGVKVNFDVIDISDYEKYQKKLNSKLYLKDGPTLIYVSIWDFYKPLTEKGIALKVKDKLKNYEKIYDSVKDEGGFFVPIGMYHYPITLNRKVFEQLGIEEPGLDWTREDYFNIREKWLTQEPRNFTLILYKELVANIMEELDIYDIKNNKVNINNSRVIEYTKNLRDEIHSGKYILKNNYTFENYYKMLFVKESEEYKEANESYWYNDTDNLRRRFYDKNALKSLRIGVDMDIDDYIILPQVIYELEKLRVWGFIVNKNGKNVDLGLEFIDGLLSDEVQLEMFREKYDYSYPVNKDIEEEIEEIEKANYVNERAVALRKYILTRIKNGAYKSSNEYGKMYKIIKEELIKEMTKFVFADEPYSDEKLSRELQKLEDKLNMWLNE
ncbi:hypothetical protein TR13x_00875 [Caloranaerobacter sp. TR13]|uniref:extracellular solute-binding protein n=1 Tax=Caloranaerobacter sp. TR13 TaxID=1302151 RepID=UPI0006D485E2|nr:extracellular solute-binding protein [Caloranaerobacter sp. TR13]KPU27937.1 hypothetical protein TR13x_00875 [Caloranaerobacter sp. TR13]